ncbi:MAG: hypothetical protein GX366_03780 [Epulopiscium sp.]|nr:hypothetical protein [Candidatus Epulonipiscium sp.]
MKLKRKLLKEDYGYTLIEFTIIIAVLGISMVAIYSLVVSAAKIQKTSEETYEATLQSQSLLQSVNKQIEKDLTDKMIKDRKGIDHGSIEVKPWLKEGYTQDPKDPPSITEFLYGSEDGLNPEQIEKRNKQIEAFNKKFKPDNFLYEVHIWELENGEIKKEIPVSFAQYEGIRGQSKDDTITTNPKEFTMVEINDAIKDYYGSKGDPLLWLSPEDPSNLKDTDIKAIGQISCKEEENKKDEIQIKGQGIAKIISGLGDLETIDGYGDIANVIKLSYEQYEEPAGESSQITHKIVIEENSSLQESKKLKNTDVIQLAVDLTTFGESNAPKTRVIRIENKTKAKVVIPVYNENSSNIDIFPIQHKPKKDEEGGRIVIQEQAIQNPATNFVVGIVVRDAYNSTFGDKNKILSKIVDVYSYDYKKQ